MNIRKRGEHLWQCVWLVSKDPATGKWTKRYETVESDSEEKVKAYWYKVREEIDRGTAINPNGLTVGAWLEEWLKLKAGQVRPSTLESYRHLVTDHLVPALGTVRLQDLRAPAIQQAIQAWRATPRKGGKPNAPAQSLSDRTVRYCFAILSMALGQAVKWQLVERNVAELVDPPAAADPPRTWWTVEDAARFLAATRSTRWGLAWHLTLHTGLRKGELLGLQWTDVDWDAGTLTVRRTLDRHQQPGPPKSRHGERTIALDPDTLALLQQAKRHTQAIWVFATKNGTPVSGRNLSRAFTAALKRAAVPPIRFHGLRHTHASLLVEAGENARVVADRLGHGQVSFTLQVYVHARSEAQRQSATALAARLRQDGGSQASGPPQ